jgi:hypothetical protein
MLRKLRTVGPIIFIALGSVFVVLSILILFQMRTTGLRPWIDLALGFGLYAIALFDLRKDSMKTVLRCLTFGWCLALAFMAWRVGLEYLTLAPERRFQGIHGFKSDSYVYMERFARDEHWAIRLKRFKSYDQKEVLADHLITESKFEQAQLAADDRPIRVRFKGTDNCLDAFGRPYFDWKYDQILECSSENRPVIAKRGSGYSLVKMDGTTVRELEFDEIEYRPEFSPPPNRTSLFKARRGAKCGFINRTTGEEVVTPLYDDVGAMENGHAPVKLGGQWGVIDARGSSVIPPQFQEARLFWGGGTDESSEGVWALEKGVWGLYDLLDKRWIIAPQLAHPGIFSLGGSPGSLRKIQAVWTYENEPILPTDQWEETGTIFLRRKR